MCVVVLVVFLLGVLSGGIHGEEDQDPLLAGTGDLQELFSNYPDDENHFSVHRWNHYANFFELNFRHFDWYSRPIRMLEIGVFNGGSAYIWQEYFGRSAGLKYVGVDIDPKCKAAENEEKNIYIEIGSQSDSAFLQSLCAKYGPFDIVIDDASHLTGDILASFEALWPHCMADNAVYAIEDLHTMNVYPNQLVNGLNVYGYFAHLMERRSTYVEYVPADPEKNQPSLYLYPFQHPLAKHLLGVHMYDSMIFLHFRKKIPLATQLLRGKKMPVQHIKEEGTRFFNPREV
jgi:hypothetical protein